MKKQYIAIDQMAEYLGNNADDEGVLSHEKMQTPFKSRLLDYPVFGRFSSNFQLVLDSCACL